MSRGIISFFIFVWINSSVYSQDSNSFKLLINDWHLDKYYIAESYYPPEDNELNDRLSLFPDLTYESVDKGILESGRWLYNKKDNTIILYDSTGSENLSLVIKYLSKEELVYTIDVKLGWDITVFMKSKITQIEDSEINE